MALLQQLGISKPDNVLRDALLFADRLRPSAGVPVLVYHKVVDGPAADLHPLAVSRERFAAQMEYLAAAGYETISAADVLSAPRRARRRVALTFDDGHADALEVAAPLMERFGFSATVFPVTDWVGTSGWLDHRNGDRLEAPRDPADLPTRFLTWDELRALRGRGWEIGSHTCSHPPLLDLTPERRQAELCESRRILEWELGAPVELFAYPYRSFGAAPAADVRVAGYRIAFSLEPGLNGPGVDPMAARRAAIRGWNDLRDVQLRLTARYTQFRRIAGAVERSDPGLRSRPAVTQPACAGCAGVESPQRTS